VFDIGWSEMALVLLVALIVIGPKDLPRVARTMGKWVAKGRSMAREFQSALEDMAREAELDKVKSEIEKASRTDFGKTIENTIDPTGELGQAFDPTIKSQPKPEDAASAMPSPEPAATAAAGPVEAAVPSEPTTSSPPPMQPAAPPPPVPSASPEAAKPSHGNGQAADLEPKPPATGNGSGSEAPKRNTAPVDPT
jgi:sec-independent protein translocase protein TatB